MNILNMRSLPIGAVFAVFAATGSLCAGELPGTMTRLEYI